MNSDYKEIVNKEIAEAFKSLISTGLLALKLKIIDKKIVTKEQLLIGAICHRSGRLASNLLGGKVITSNYSGNNLSIKTESEFYLINFTNGFSNS